MNEYEKYRLQWMLDHDYSLPDLLERLSDIAMNENLDEIQNPRVMLNEAFERLEYEQGFDNEEIWLRKDEWEHDLYSSNEYSLTDAGKTKVKHFIEDCRIKQDSILKAGLDIAKETTLPSVEDILCNVEDMVDEDGKYTNAWNITDNYLSDPLELNKDDDFVIHSNEQVKDVLIPLPLVVKETPLPPSYEVSTSQPHYTEVNLFDVSDDEKNKIAKEMVNKPFELQDELTSARNRQKEINKILDTSGNENSKVVVEDDLEEERNESCMEL